MGLCTSVSSNIPRDKEHIKENKHENRNMQLHAALSEMRIIRKVIHDKKENEALYREGKATECTLCLYIMPHVTTRRCTCHGMSCERHNPASSCTIFRKVSKI